MIISSFPTFFLQIRTQANQLFEKAENISIIKEDFKYTGMRHSAQGIRMQFFLNY